MNVQTVNHMAAKYNSRVYRIIENHGVMVQMAEECTAWLGLWNVGWYPCRGSAIEATIQHLKECEQMNIFSTNLFPYLEGLMIKDKPVTMTIKSVVNEKVSSQRGEEIKTTIHFKERDKALILNKTNAKQIVVFFGGNTDDWIGKRITLYAEEGTWFGKHGWAVRVAADLPKQNKPTPKAKQNGTAKPDINDVEDVPTAEQAELLATSNPGAFD